jgi:hypothetical protein
MTAVAADTASVNSSTGTLITIFDSSGIVFGGTIARISLSAPNASAVPSAAAAAARTRLSVSS